MARLYIVLIYVFALAACVPDIQPLENVRMQSRLDHDAIICFDGARLPYRSWLPTGPPSAVVLALHGFNDYSKFIDQTAMFLADRGIAVYAYDQRGFGEAPLRGHWPGIPVLANDLKIVFSLLHGRYPGIPLYILGESMGGAVAMVAMAGEKPPVCAGVILAAPAVWSRATMPWVYRVVLWLAAHTMPGLRLTGQSFDIQASDNKEMLKGLGRDPLVIKETRIEVTYGLANLMDAAYDLADRYPAPTLMLYGEHDELVPKKPVMDVFSRLPGAVSGDQRLFIYKNGFHMLLRDLQADIVRRDILEWLENPGGPIPSVAEKLSVERKQLPPVTGTRTP